MLPIEQGHRPAAFAWTGTHRLFAACGFEVVGNPDGGKRWVRRRITALGITTGS